MATEDIELRQVPLTDAQRSALVAARAHNGQITGASVLLAALERKGLAARVNLGDWRWTTLGRYQVAWYADDCAAAWDVSTSTWNTYVRRGTAPAPDYPGTLKSTVDRAWWDPDKVRGYVRPGSTAGPESQRVKLDHAEVLRAWRSGGYSIGTLAERFSVSATTMSALLERMGEKPPTTASMRAGHAGNRTVIEVTP
jgi:hypothetical protein